MSTPRHAILRLLLLAAVAGMSATIGCGVPGPDGPADSFGLDLTPPPDAEIRGAVVFIVDGVNAGIFQDMLAAGELPAIDRYFARRGLYVPRATANTPSVTLANLTSLVTARFPGHHNITGINWYDRERHLWRDYATIAQKNTLDGDYTAENIYEQFPGEMTVSIFFQPHRGTTKFFENWTSAGPPYFFGWYEFVDRLTLFRFGEMMDLARERGEFPVITCAYLLAPDFQAYDHGVSSEEYRQALLHTDYQIGRVLGDMERAGLLESLYIALISDHSLLDVNEHFVLESFLREQGLDIAEKQLWEETDDQARKDYYERFPCVLYGSGDRYWAICLRKPIRGTDGEIAFEPWPIRPDAADLAKYPIAEGTTLDLPALLAARPEVDALAYAAGPNRCRVRNAHGEVEFHQPGGRRTPIFYRIVRGEDPLGWSQAVPAEYVGRVDGDTGEGADEMQWLEWTAMTQYPDLPAQILAYFRAPRAGDIAVFAAEGYDFNDVHQAGHGGLKPGDMHVPLLLAGPGITPQQRSTARTIDLTPTLLHLLGQTVPEGMDGRSLLPTQYPAVPETPVDGPMPESSPISPAGG